MNTMIRLTSTAHDHNMQRLIQIFKAVAKSASIDQTRRVLNGVLVRGTSLVATDGRRLAMANFHPESDALLIEAGKAAGMFIDDDKDRIYTVVKAGQKELIVMLMDGNLVYPNYLQVIPAGDPNESPTEIKLFNKNDGYQWDVMRAIINRSMHTRKPDANGVLGDALVESNLALNPKCVFDGMDLFIAAGETECQMIYTDAYSPLCFRGMVPEVPTPKVPATVIVATGEVVKPPTPAMPDTRPYHVRAALKDERGACYGLTYVLMPLRVS